ncbi:Uncharacterized protein BM_BM7235 [Brugia malayi]|uniref:Bm7235 n=1 Tax=Brugia malayi TaxID=6279 RepID=A0A0K0JRG1_BRUMA|nr:Uncharacterized protein BM_BM7235 [Brugia malayi]CTP82016.1 Bm7235 [Brugia malayi]VIO96519.1 Uncharacterized protein BM_BM7235 [Brugia malayi]
MVCFKFILTPCQNKKGKNLWEAVYQKVLCVCSSISSGREELTSWDFSFFPDKLTYRIAHRQSLFS